MKGSKSKPDFIFDPRGNRNLRSILNGEGAEKGQVIWSGWEIRQRASSVIQPLGDKTLQSNGRAKGEKGAYKSNVMKVSKIKRSWQHIGYGKNEEWGVISRF